tara:strand:- start:1956 stop:2528 length:573 start_codon:yes stop_codon:yes gene_type:complete
MVLGLTPAPDILLPSGSFCFLLLGSSFDAVHPATLEVIDLVRLDDDRELVPIIIQLGLDADLARETLLLELLERPEDILAGGLDEAIDGCGCCREGTRGGLDGPESEGLAFRGGEELGELLENRGTTGLDGFPRDGLGCLIGEDGFPGRVEREVAFEGERDDLCGREICDLLGCHIDSWLVVERCGRVSL